MQVVSLESLPEVAQDEIEVYNYLSSFLSELCLNLQFSGSDHGDGSDGLFNITKRTVPKDSFFMYSRVEQKCRTNS
jgi:hypothetical protein